MARAFVFECENGVLASLPRHHFLRKRGCAAVAIISCTVGGCRGVLDDDQHQHGRLVRRIRVVHTLML